jgi:hypothetical protein
MMNQLQAGGVHNLDKSIDKLKAMGNIIKPLLEDLKKLGPEGELIAAVGEGGLAIATSFINAADVMKLTTDDFASATEEKFTKISAGLQVVAATIQAISGILNAASNARIAQIDKEIAAETKRDGKSKQSMAKIAALEKKKDAEKKKQFNVNKKLQMAMVVVNTAMAASAAIAAGAQAAALTGTGTAMPAWVSAFVGIVTAMGAIQLAIIAGTSYEGGGGIAQGGGTPGSVAVGQRRSTVDVSKSQNAGGELSYLRGESGTGGPENFRGAFYGKRHRAAGGATGYVVGEQGPELFMPDRPGTIVPADDTAAAMSAGGNVTFNISTIDATGIEEVLEEQQGNIIGMLRQAANSYGEDFFENIDESTYAAPQARRA